MCVTERGNSGVPLAKEPEGEHFIFFDYKKWREFTSLALLSLEHGSTGMPKIAKFRHLLQLLQFAFDYYVLHKLTAALELQYRIVFHATVNSIPPVNKTMMLNGHRSRACTEVIQGTSRAQS